MKETFIKYANDNKDKLNHEYDFYFYYANQEYFKSIPNDLVCMHQETDNIINVSCNLPESIYRTFEKTIFVFNEIKGYDWYIRINISNFINIKLLDKVIHQFDKSFIYCNAINTIVSDEDYLNDIYPRGDFYMMSSTIKSAIMPEAKKLLFSDVTLDYSKRCNVIHVDDCLLGVALVKTFGNVYQDMIKMLKYNFLPREGIEGANTFAISSRVKTLPPDVNYSGYSWENNESRKYDAKKMDLLYDMMNLCNYKNISYKDLLEDEEKGRPTIFVQYVQAPASYIKIQLKTKKRGK